MQPVGYHPLMPRPADQSRRALKLLADSASGHTEAILLAHGVALPGARRAHQGGLADGAGRAARPGNFLCEATGVNCIDPRCKRGSCIMEQEVARVAIAVIKATNADGAKAARARRIDPTHAWRVLCEAVRGMTVAQVRERLASDRELQRMAWAVPKVRAEYGRLMKEKATKAGK